MSSAESADASSDHFCAEARSFRRIGEAAEDEGAADLRPARAFLVGGAGGGLGGREVALPEGGARRDVLGLGVAERAEGLGVLRPLVPLPELQAEVRDLAQVGRPRGLGREIHGLLDGGERLLGPSKLEEHLRVHVPDVEHPRVLREELREDRVGLRGVPGREVAEPRAQLLERPDPVLRVVERPPRSRSTGPALR